MDIIKKLFKELNKHGVSATIVAIILLVVGFAIVVLLVIFTGQKTQGGVSNIIEKLNLIRHGGK